MERGVYLSLLTGIGPALENRNKTAKFFSLIIRSVSKQFSEVYGAHLAGVAAQVIITTTIQLFIVCTFHQIFQQSISSPCPEVHFLPEFLIGLHLDFMASSSRSHKSCWAQLAGQIVHQPTCIQCHPQHPGFLYGGSSS